MQFSVKITVELKKENITTSHCLPTKVKANGERCTNPPAIIGELEVSTDMVRITQSVAKILIMIVIFTFL